MPRSRREVLEKSEQPELDGMPPASPIGKAARAYMKACDEMEATVEALKEKKGAARARLVDEMKNLNKKSVTIDGYNYTLVHIEEQDSIKISKPRIKG